MKNNINLSTEEVEDERKKKEKFTAWRKLRIGRRDRENRKKIIASARIADEKKKYKKGSASQERL